MGKFEKFKEEVKSINKPPEEDYTKEEILKIKDIAKKYDLLTVITLSNEHHGFGNIQIMQKHRSPYESIYKETRYYGYVSEVKNKNV